jgi:hypothetical protein
VSGSGRDLPAELHRLAHAGREETTVEPGASERALLALIGVAGTGGDLDDQLGDALGRLRRASAREALSARGFDLGLRLEDAVAVTARVSSPEDEAPARRWLGRRLPAEARVEIVVGGPVFLAAALAGRVGHAPERPQYALGPDGRMRVEAFELHVTEHCNLRCEHCCNMSPFVAEETMPVDAVERLCRQMAGVLAVDVFKIMGGEPLLHPDIAGVLRAVRGSGISPKVRLFTNGLLLAAMKPAFWSSLDELTISSYASAPVRPHLLELARAQAKAHGFVLNVKDVGAFSQVLSDEYRGDHEEVARTFQRCWLRHRCLVVRRDRFFMCTRAAYAPDFLARVACQPPPAEVEARREQDGVPLAGEDLPGRLVAYMNRTAPLAACHHCLGGDGPLSPHRQLTKPDVAAGRLRSTRAHDA